MIQKKRLKVGGIKKIHEQGRVCGEEWKDSVMVWGAPHQTWDRVILETGIKKKVPVYLGGGPQEGLHAERGVNRKKGVNIHM